jgi:hypothetical protein
MDSRSSMIDTAINTATGDEFFIRLNNVSTKIKLPHKTI